MRTMTTISSVVLSMGSSPSKVKTAQRRQEFLGILYIKGLRCRRAFLPICGSHKRVVSGKPRLSG